MTDSDPLRRYVEVGLALTQLTRARAEALVKELVKAGEVQRDHAQERVEELVDRSKKGTEQLVNLIRTEMAQQLSAMGFATKDDLERLEQRLAGGAGRAAAKKAASKKSAAEKAPVAKKAPARKGAAKKAPKKAAAKAAAAKKAKPSGPGGS